MLKALRTVLALVLALATIQFVSGPAQANGPGIVINVDGNGNLGGSSVTGYGDNSTLYLTIYVEGGALVKADNETSGVTVATNFRNDTRGIHVFGTQPQLNAFFAALTVSKRCGATFKVYGQVSTRQIMRNPGNGHFYLLGQQGPADFPGALNYTRNTVFPLNSSGTKGYFGNITTEDEYAFISSTFNFNLVLGASDSAQEGKWVWAAGPERGRQFYRGNYPLGESVKNALTYWGFESPSPNDVNSDYLLSAGGTWTSIADVNDNQLIEFGGMKGDNLKITDSSLFSESVFTGTVQSPAFAKGIGSLRSPYQVSSAAGILSTGQCGVEGAFFKQTRDITLPADYDSDGLRFVGFYNGANRKINWSKSVSNPSYLGHDEAGIWSTIGLSNSNSVKTSIRNLKISGYVDTVDTGTTGMLAGIVVHSYLRNINVSGTMLVGGDSFAIGGVVGYSEYSDFDRVNSKVNFQGEEQVQSVGGVIAETAEAGRIHQSTWSGKVAINGTGAWDGLGGLIGYSVGWDVYHNQVNGKITVGDYTLVGGLVGESTRGYLVGNRVTISITALGGTKVGGFAGRSNSNVEQNVVISKGITAADYVGGFVGQASGTLQDNLYQGGKSKVTATARGGSFTALVDGTVRNNIAIGQVIAETTGGALGAVDSGASITNLVWSPSSAKVNQSDPLRAGETPKTVAQMKALSTYSVLDFSISNRWKANASWTLCGKVNGGFPFPTAAYSSSPCPGKK